MRYVADRDIYETSILGADSRKRFGTVRKLPSGRWQVRYTGSDGLRRNAPDTFGTKTAGERWLVETEAEMLRGEWLDPEAGKITLME